MQASLPVSFKRPWPLVWVPADHRVVHEDGHDLPFLMLGDKYARALQVGAQAQAVVFALAQAHQIEHLLPLVDGVMLTGSPSNVHPSHFNEAVAHPQLPLDTERDQLTLALVQACLKQGVPLLGICRGFQEMNVALGGSLHQAVHEQPAYQDHRERPTDPLHVQYGPAHAIHLQPNSCLARWVQADQVQVNSLHGQGIHCLAPGLKALAHAPDGLIEAFEVSDSAAFAMAVQWHPEWENGEQPLDKALFKAFGQACRKRQCQKQASMQTHRQGEPRT